MSGPHLVVFDCDGTLVDSQHTIIEAMEAAFAEIGHAPPPANDIRHVVGLSLPEAALRLLPESVYEMAEPLQQAYRKAFISLREQGKVREPLYPGAREALAALKEEGVLLGIATGKSRRGLEKTLVGHGIGDLFDTLQTADFNPGKPDPAMLRRALEETGAGAHASLFIGDTTYDMMMAKAAQVTGLGVAWGYHEPQLLRAEGAAHILEGFDEVLPHALDLKP